MTPKEPTAWLKDYLESLPSLLEELDRVERPGGMWRGQYWDLIT